MYWIVVLCFLGLMAGATFAILAYEDYKKGRWRRVVVGGQPFNHRHYRNCHVSIDEGIDLTYDAVRV